VYLLRKPVKTQDLILPDYGLVYLDHLKGESEGLCQGKKTLTGECDPYLIAKKIITKADEEQPLTWGDLYALEKAILDLQPIEVVRERGWSIEARYRDAAGIFTAFDGWVKQNPANDEAAVRARTENLVRELYRLYTVTACREALRTRLSRITSILIIVGGVIGTVMSILRPEGLWTWLCVAYAGAIGGFISFQRRVQSLPSRGESLSEIVELAGGTGMYLSPITGAIFAVVLFMLFTSQILKGVLFPTIATITATKDTGWAFKDFIEQTGAKTGSDFASLLIWSFIAGFAERFVPDTLDRLIARQQEEKARPNSRLSTS